MPSEAIHWGKTRYKEGYMPPSGSITNFLTGSSMKFIFSNSSLDIQIFFISSIYNFIIASCFYFISTYFCSAVPYILLMKHFLLLSVWGYSVQFSCSVVSNSLGPHGLQHARLPCPSPTPGACSNHICWVSDSIQPSHPLSSPSPPALNLPASGSFPVSQLFASGGQSIGVSASTSVLPMNTQDWSPLGWTGWISLQSKGLLRVFSNTTVQKHQFFGTQLSL